MGIDLKTVLDVRESLMAEQRAAAEKEKEAEISGQRKALVEELADGLALENPEIVKRMHAMLSAMAASNALTREDILRGFTKAVHRAEEEKQRHDRRLLLRLLDGHLMQDAPGSIALSSQHCVVSVPIGRDETATVIIHADGLAALRALVKEDKA